jgi:hypothetical protein
MKLEIGQTIFVEVFPHRGPTEIKECQIEKIGNKYFYLDKYQDKGFDKQTLKYVDKKYAQHNLQAYLTTQEITDRHEKARLCEVLKRHFETWGDSKNNTLEELKQSCELLKLTA